ncbi:hypothetical protein [Tenacibaculum sp. 190130A14a]
MNKVVLFLFIITTNLCFSQHTESYLTFANNFKISDPSKVEVKWRNGNIKELKNVIKLKHNNKEYELLTGTYLQFNKKGIKRTESLFDQYGNYLSYKLFDLDGNIITEFVTLKIDYNDDGLVEITQQHKDYIKHKGSNYLYIKGNKLNNQKIDIWYTYDYCGNIIKEKNHAR